MNWEVVKQLVEYGRSIEEANNKKFRFTLTTNGILLNDEILEFANKEMSNIVLSIDGRKEINDLMRPTRNDTEVLMILSCRSLRRLQKAETRPIIM